MRRTPEAMRRQMSVVSSLEMLANSHPASLAVGEPCAIHTTRMDVVVAMTEMRPDPSRHATSFRDNEARTDDLPSNPPTCRLY